MAQKDSLGRRNRSRESDRAITKKGFDFACGGGRVRSALKGGAETRAERLRDEPKLKAFVQEARLRLVGP